MSEYKRAQRTWWPVITVLVALTLAALGTAVMAEQATPADVATQVPGGIQGIVYLSDGMTPVAQAWVDIHDQAEQPWMGTAAAGDGSFSITNLPPGRYFLTAHPPPGSPEAASLTVVVDVLSGQWSTTSLSLTEALITGWVQDSDTGTRIPDVGVVAFDNPLTVERWCTTDAAGEFKIGGVTPGVTYTLETVVPPGSPYVPLPIHYEVTPPATDFVLEMMIPPTNVVGIVHEYTGTPVPGAAVVIHQDEYWRETTADETGFFAFSGLPAGDYVLVASPPWDVQGLLPSAAIPVAIATPTSLVDVGIVVLPQAFKTVSGHVRNAATGQGVAEAVVMAHRLDTPAYVEGPTDSQGAYTLSLPGGEWHLSVAPLDPHAEWFFPGPPAWVPFMLPVDQAESLTADLAVEPTNGWIEGRVVCPGGAPCGGIIAPEAVHVELRSDGLQRGFPVGPDFGFSLPVPDGWHELLVHVEHPILQGGPPVSVFVAPGQAVDVGDILLLERDALITGRVQNEQGVGIADVVLTGRVPDAPVWGEAVTDATGHYTMSVVHGEWFVEPHPGPEISYVFRQSPRLVRVAEGGTIEGIDFVLSRAEARIEGIAVDATSGERLWDLDGWTSAERQTTTPDGLEFFSEAPMRQGAFVLKVKGNETYLVGVGLPSHAAHASGGAGPIAVAPGQWVVVTVPLDRKDSAIEGQLIDSLTGLPPEQPVWAEVFGEDQAGHWGVTEVVPESAEYGMSVISGTWHMRAFVDPASGYVAVPGTTVVSALAGQTTTQNFEIWPVNGVISGTVHRPDGQPLAGAFVFAAGNSPVVGPFEAHSESDATGTFTLVVPEGGYEVGATLPPSELDANGWLNPPPVDVPMVSAVMPATGLDITFRALDSTITGVVALPPSASVTVTHAAYVWGWSDNGEWSEAEAQPVTGTGTFTYTLPVVGNTVWHIGAVYEDWDNGLFYESAEQTVTLGAPPSQAVQNLDLAGPYALPQPFIVSFDGTQMQTIVMPDGVVMTIPAKALTNSGTVTLFIFPTQELRPEAGREIIGAGYEMWAVDQNGQEIVQFNKRVLLTFQYPPDATLASQGISEDLLVPMYYSTLAGHWILADRYALDTINNEITCQLSHFTTFTVMTAQQVEHWVRLPLVYRGIP